MYASACDYKTAAAAATAVALNTRQEIKLRVIRNSKLSYSQTPVIFCMKINMIKTRVISSKT
jgi:hypothetical protein